MDILSVLNNTWGADMGKTGVSSFLRRYRSKHGLSREALAEKLDISDSYLAALELGTRKPSYDTLLKIVLAPGAHSQFGSGKNSQFKPER